MLFLFGCVFLLGARGLLNVSRIFDAKVGRFLGPSRAGVITQFGTFQRSAFNRWFAKRIDEPGAEWPRDMTESDFINSLGILNGVRWPKAHHYQRGEWIAPVVPSDIFEEVMLHGDRSLFSGGGHNWEAVDRFRKWLRSLPPKPELIDPNDPANYPGATIEQRDGRTVISPDGPGRYVRPEPE